MQLPGLSDLILYLIVLVVITEGGTFQSIKYPPHKVSYAKIVANDKVLFHLLLKQTVTIYLSNE